MIVSAEGSAADSRRTITIASSFPYTSDITRGIGARTQEFKRSRCDKPGIAERNCEAYDVRAGDPGRFGVRPGLERQLSPQPVVASARAVPWRTTVVSAHRCLGDGSVADVAGIQGARGGHYGLRSHFPIVLDAILLHCRSSPERHSLGRGSGRNSAYCRTCVLSERCSWRRVAFG